MTHQRHRACLAAAALILGTTWSAAADAGCLRRVYNRSAYVLVASRDGGPPVTLLPGRSVPLRLEHPGRLNLTAYCAVPGAASRPVAEASFDYEAVLDRCFVRFGDAGLRPEFGGGFSGKQGTAPFTVNNPAQGDVILGPFTADCPVLSRGG
ncbi:hypothetical protein [Methylobacterium dankookense]|uniref:Uncharacterized protein n=1 Tax=Methylobacterium dankookense TaxID=560405 RepID=A0A564G6N5_9HYPH|nr:hypothetical protein [Methylobacterium dankookense]GJD54635.1 hypothetical protein IFDJLNFL_0510 [Methylobacterium dankookense]VUF15694.1 hypothetical protein MTDSW087_05438 [Methylobacterium dankookense]